MISGILHPHSWQKFDSDAFLFSPLPQNLRRPAEKPLQACDVADLSPSGVGVDLIRCESLMELDPETRQRVSRYLRFWPELYLYSKCVPSQDSPFGPKQLSKQFYVQLCHMLD